MSHKFYDGVIYHKRYLPKKHTFEYKFFMLDIDLKSFQSLKIAKFGINKFNLFSFDSKDHFGKNSDFLQNVDYLLNELKIQPSNQMRFITLPRICGFVFNPISLLLLFENNKPNKLIAEVHNYNGGRVIYSVDLKTSNNKTFTGKTQKDMYVSPFFNRDGEYEFTLTYKQDMLNLNIKLFENNQKKLVSNFQGKAVSYSTKSIKKLFFKHTLLTFWVVTRTIYQSIKLKLKGLKWNEPLKKDTKRRY